MSFGRELQHEREGREVSLDLMAERTRVPERFLGALEREQFDELPGGVFNKGILRSYCRDLGLDEEEWLQRFEAASLTGPPPDWSEFAENVKLSRPPAASSTGVRWWGVLLMLFALTALVWAAWKYVVQPRVLRSAPPAAQTAGSCGSHAGGSAAPGQC
jgi:cytoskeletal protein RodZ